MKYSNDNNYDEEDEVIGFGVKRTWTPSRGRSTSSPIKTRSSRFSNDSRWKFLRTVAKTTFSSITAYFWPRKQEINKKYINKTCFQQRYKSANTTK